jgi:hypothetical protein
MWVLNVVANKEMSNNTKSNFYSCDAINDRRQSFCYFLAFTFEKKIVEREREREREREIGYDYSCMIFFQNSMTISNSVPNNST